jgi:HPr kinase/phosphorylase
MTTQASVHASAVLVGDRAVLIRGPSGSGKSRLAFDLILAGRAGRFRRPCWSATIASISTQRRTAGGPAGARTGRADRNSRARHSPLRLRRAGDRRPGGRSCRGDAERLPPPEALSDAISGVKYREFPSDGLFSPSLVVPR